MNRSISEFLKKVEKPIPVHVEPEPENMEIVIPPSPFSPSDPDTDSDTEMRDMPSTTRDPGHKQTPIIKRDTTKHRQTFDPLYLKQFPWLLVDTHENPENVKKMWCKVCRRHNKTGKKGFWVQRPCTSLRLDKIKGHAKSEAHKCAVESEVTRVNASTHLLTALHVQETVQRKAMKGLMNIVYTLAKKHHAVSSSNVLDFVDLCTDLGADYLLSIRQGDNAKYTSERVMRELLESLSGTLRDAILEDARQSPVFEAQADETTDVSVKSQVISYIRYIKGTEVKTSFLGIRELRDGKAETVYNKVVEMIQEADLDMEHKLSGFTSDGAAVMCGRKSGVAARLKQMVPWMLSYHCANHRTALAAAHASDAVPAVKKAKEALGHIFRFFSYSAVRTENLKEIKRVLDMPVVKLQEAKDVRWLSHHQAVTAMLKCYPAVVTTLEYEAEGRNCPTARGLAHQLETFTFVAFLHMMADVLPQLKIMCQLFQVFQPYIEHLLRQLEDQFPDLATLSTLTLMDPAGIDHPEDEDYMAVYGDDQLEDLIQHFTNLDGEAMRQEWPVVRRMLPEMQPATLQHTLCQLTTLHSRTLPNFQKLAAISLVLAASSADCERGFSHMRLVKTYMRNRLSEQSLESLLLLAIEGPPRQEFAFDSAVDRWAAMHRRRVDVSK